MSEYAFPHNNGMNLTGIPRSAARESAGSEL
jgi:hypothetical protein